MSDPKKTTTKTAALLAELESLFEDFDKAAESLTEPGGREGPSSHPSAKVDDNTVEVPEGEHAKEMERYVKENVPTGGVDGSTPSNTTQESRQFQINTKQTGTGHDPATEKDYSTTLKDPGGREGGSDHPTAKDIKTAADELSFEEAYKAASDYGNSLLSDICTLLSGHTYLESTPQPQHPEKQAESSPNDLEAGIGADEQAYIQSLQQEWSQWSKQAVADTIRDAHVSADAVGTYILTLAEEVQKQAMNKGGDDAAAAAAAAEAAAAGAPPAGGDQIDPAVLQALLEAEAAGAGGGEAPPSGGDQIDPAVLQALLEAEAANAKGEGAPAGSDEAISDEEALNELLAAMEESGEDPEALLAALSEQEQAPKQASENNGSDIEKRALQLLVKSAIEHRDAGKYRPSHAKAGSRKRILRNQIKQVISEFRRKR